MIDFVHLFRRVPNHRLFLERKDIVFVEGMPYHGNETIKYFWHKDKVTGCNIKCGYNNWIDFTGSITKYFYEENYSNLPYSDLVSAIYDLSDNLYSRPNDLVLKSFEFGVNVLLEIPFNALELSNSALCYKSKFFQDMDGDNKKSIGKRCVLQEYQLKIYSKSMQYNLPFELLRYEIKVHKMNYLRPLSFESLQDLTDKNKLHNLKQILIESLNKIIIYDNTIPLGELRSLDRNLCLNWQSQIYRNTLLHSNLRTFNNQKKRLIELIEEYGNQNLKPMLIHKFSDRWDNLMES